MPSTGYCDCMGLHSRRAKSSRVVPFSRDDSGYLAWLGSHPQGYVVNCNNPPLASYVKLHRASCGHLHRAGVKHWTKDYMKLCAPTSGLLDKHVFSEVGVYPDRCPACHP